MIDLQKARETLDRKCAARRKVSLERFAVATRDAQAIIALLVSKYHPVRIYQWGSLLNSGKFTECSDIDIAIEGITDAETFFGLLGDVTSMTEIPADIVQMEKIEKEFADAIRQKGKIVYERS